MKGRWLTLVLSVVLAAALCSPAAWPQVRSGPVAYKGQLRGQVRYAEGPAASDGILVTLESALGGVVAQIQTESQGKFAFAQLLREVYVVTVRHPGYREVAERVDLTTSPTAYVVLELQPLPRDSSAPASPETTGQLVSVKQLAVPEKAQKEFEKGYKQLLEMRDPQTSIAHFLKAIEQYPAYAQAHLLLGTAYMAMNQGKEAQAAFEEAVKLDDTLAAAYLALGACLNQQGNFVAAEKPLLRGLELNPQAAEGHYELGRVYWALGRWQDAEPHARKAAALHPDFAPVHVLLGNIMLRKRDAQAALQEFKEYLRLEPEGPLAAATREMVAKIEKALAAPR